MFSHTTQMFFGACANFRRVVDLADRYASSPWPMLLLGETGVGKELFARRIHEHSSRRTGPFVPINCGALPRDLVESELFGHEKGSFSGAQQMNRGLIRSAQGGTLFLDEIGDLDLDLQVKLLRLLDSGEIRPVGSNRFEHIDVRIVAATNVDLTAAVRAGKFRMDLLERLSVLTLRIPSLRERADDIPLIASELLDKLLCRHRKEDLEVLKTFHWPGNVRQLRNFLIRASVRATGSVSVDELAMLIREENALLTPKFSMVATAEMVHEGSLADIEKRAIVERLKQCRGNRKRAARELGIAKSTLHEKLRRWKIEFGDDSVLDPSDAWVPSLEPRAAYATGLAV